MALTSAPCDPGMLDGFVNDLSAHLTGQLEPHPHGYQRYAIERNEGAKFVRFVRKVVFHDGQVEEHGCAYAFVERATGLVFRPDGWKRPAKHARGSIHDDSWRAACGQHGVAYMR